MPPQSLPSPLLSRISRLDAEMKAVLDKPELDDETKVSAYSQVLSKYLSAREQYARPTPIPVIDIPPTTEKSSELQLDAIPKQYTRKAQILLEHIRRSPNIGWNERNELVLEGQAIPNSNIVDLLDDLVRPRAKLNPRGVGDFVRALKKVNVPETLINNRDRWIGEESILLRSPHRHQASPKAVQIEEPNLRTPSPVVKRKKVRGRTQTGEGGIKWSKW